jgi:hypothetical protein
MGTRIGLIGLIFTDLSLSKKSVKISQISPIRVPIVIQQEKISSK